MAARINSQVQTRIDELLKSMDKDHKDSWDKDKRFMAACDMTELIKSSEDLPLSSQKAIIEAFVKQLGDESVDVKSNAVKCIAAICQTFPEDQLGLVLTTLSSGVVNEKPEVRDIFATCLKGVIERVGSPGAAETFCKSIVPNMEAGLAKGPGRTAPKSAVKRVKGFLSKPVAKQAASEEDDTEQVKEECCYVLADVLRRFGDSRCLLEHHDALSNSLLGLLEHGSRPSLISRVVVTIGTLCTWLPNKKLEPLIIKLLGKLGSNSASALKRPSAESSPTVGDISISQHRYLKCLCHVGRCVGHRMAPFINQTAPLLLDIIQHVVAQNADGDAKTLDADDASSDAMHHMAELCVTAIESYLTTCPVQMMRYLDLTDKLILQSLSFDPNYYASADDGEDDDVENNYDMNDSTPCPTDNAWEAEGDEFLDDDEAQSALDDDDTSWKVRRGALKLIVAMLRSHPDHYGNVYRTFTLPLVSRCSEREENVKLELFATLSCLIESCVIMSPTMRDGGAAAPAHSTDDQYYAPVAPHTSQDSLRMKWALRSESEILRGYSSKIIAALGKQLKTSRSAQVQQAVLSVLTSLAWALPQCVEGRLHNLQGEVIKALSDPTAVVRTKALYFIQTLAVNHKSSTAYNLLAVSLLDACARLCKDPYYKISAHALGTCTAYVEAMALESAGEIEEVETREKNLQLVSSLIQTVSTLMTITELDIEVKEAVIECFGRLSALLGEIPELDSAMALGLPGLIERFKFDSTRKFALSSLNLLCSAKRHFDISAVDGGACLSSATEMLIELLLQSQRHVRKTSIDILINLTRSYGEKMQLAKITMCSSELISPEDHHTTESCLCLLTVVVDCCTGPPAAKPHAAAKDVCDAIMQRTLPRVLTLCRASRLQGRALEACLEFFTKLSQLPSYFPLSPIAKQLMDLSPDSIPLTAAPRGAKSQSVDAGASIDREVLAGLALCVSCLVNDQQMRDDIVAECMKIVNSELSSTRPARAGRGRSSAQLAVLILGEIGRRYNISDTTQQQSVFNKLNAVLSTSSDAELQNCTAKALGCITVGALASHLPVLVAQLNSCDSKDSAAQPAAARKKRYLLLTSLREVITQHNVKTENITTAANTVGDHILPHIPQILPLLVESCAATDENDRIIVSECLAQLLIIDPSNLAMPMLNLLRDSNEMSCIVALTAIRHAMVRHCAPSVIAPLRDAFVGCFDSNNLEIRRACWLVIAAAASPPFTVDFICDISLLTARALRDTQFYNDYIRIVHLGPFVEEVDDGLPVRKAAFQGLSATIRSCPHLVDASRFVNFVCTGLNEALSTARSHSGSGARGIDDILTISCQMLAELARHLPVVNKLVLELDRVVDPANAVLERKCKPQVENSSVDDIIRALTRTLYTVLQRLAAFYSVIQALSSEMTHQPHDHQPVIAALQAAQPSIPCKKFLNFLSRCLEDPRFANCWAAYACRIDV